MMNTGEADTRSEATSPEAAVLRLNRSDGFFEFDKEQCARVGKQLHADYVRNGPFPHIVIDDLVARPILDQVVAEFPAPREGKFRDEFSQKKTGYRLEKVRSAYINDLMAAFNSAAFLDFLENLTGISGLVTDSRFTGGGLHETRRGGHLSVHADFNIHPATKLRRRLNLILFLNEGWDSDWGGGLELWEKDMSRQRVTAWPEIGRAVIFNTESDSYHGHPNPLECPDHVTRKSIALYYYSAPPPFVIPHTTIFRARPGTGDTNTSLLKRLHHSARMIFGKGGPTD